MNPAQKPGWQAPNTADDPFPRRIEIRIKRAPSGNGMVPDNRPAPADGIENHVAPAPERLAQRPFDRGAAAFRDVKPNPVGSDDHIRPCQQSVWLRSSGKSGSQRAWRGPHIGATAGHRAEPCAMREKPSGGIRCGAADHHIYMLNIRCVNDPRHAASGVTSRRRIAALPNPAISPTQHRCGEKLLTNTAFDCSPATPKKSAVMAAWLGESRLAVQPRKIRLKQN